MPNITDYLAWRGDVTLAERPFNDVDNVILATLSYVDFTGIVPAEATGGAVDVASALRTLLAETGEDVAPRIRSLAQVNAPFLRALAASERFGGALLSNYVDVRDEDRRMQFSALHVALADGAVYVSLRGTDQTLLGWREDFLLGCEVTGAQVASADYLERTMRPDGRYLVGGHSKGGNLAMYAAMAIPQRLRDRIACVYSDDGPGIAPEVLPAGGYGLLEGKLRRIVPSFSIVGMLLDPEGVPKGIVTSSASGVAQHDPLTWQTGATGLVLTDGLLPECKVWNQSFSRLLDGVGLEDRRNFTNQMFDALSAGGATTLDGIFGGGVGGIQQIANAIAASDPRTKDVLVRLLQA
ncbi:MAG: Mbeg1-like protein, partial [Atopobiaceae bacterium]